MGRNALMKIISSYTLTDLFLTLISASILILGIVVGYSISTSYEIKAQITTANSSSYLSILYHILATNFSIIAFVSILGYITCGVLSICIIFYNGIRIGETLNTNSDSVWNVLKFLIGHGIFEILALVLFTGIGLKGYRLYQDLYRNSFSKGTLPHVNLFIIPTMLLLFAGIIEAFCIKYL
ncbi:MAG: stage II sporulation protein M [Bacteroidales bacterium]|nr:stage II sporulation protein M [Bacteroidales bacterium]